MFYFRTGLIAWATSRPSTKNKARTFTQNEQFIGVNSPVENVHGLKLMQGLVLWFLYIH